MRPAVSIRPAAAGDAEAMSRVLIASITELCLEDHHGDPERIAAWTRNKTPNAVRAMLEGAVSEFYVAEAGGVIAGVGCVDPAGAIRLNYVAPAFRFRGVSTALLAAMEAALGARGAGLARLESTAAAHRFYLGRGWRDDIGGAGGANGARPMWKEL